jgi:serine/threonine protein kinase
VYEFQAIGPGIKQTWRRRLPAEGVVRLGRAPQLGWAVPWDLRISREHADLTVEGEVLRVRRLATARNSIYVRGQPVDEFVLGPGEDFRIGQTVFRLSRASSEQSAASSRSSSCRPASDGESSSWRDVVLASDKQRLQLLLAQLPDDETSDQQPDVGLPEDEAWAAWPEAFFPLRGLDGSALGLYELAEPLHRSATGQVLKARHRYLERWSALQILACSSASPQAVARFRRKARWTAAFDHPHIVRTYEGGYLDGVHYLIMEYLDGWTLANGLLRQQVATATAVDYILQAARGLAHAHQQQVIHCDVTPAHLMLTRQGTVKVIGWGQARQLGSRGSSAGEAAERVGGTPGFLAPELFANSARIDERTDVYALGCTLYALLASQALLPPGWQSARTADETGPQAPPLRDVRPETPDCLEAVYQKMLAESPAERWASMAEVIEALERVLDAIGNGNGKTC